MPHFRDVAATEVRALKREAGAAWHAALAVVQSDDVHEWLRSMLSDPDA